MIDAADAGHSREVALAIDDDVTVLEVFCFEVDVVRHAYILP